MEWVQANGRLLLKFRAKQNTECSVSQPSCSVNSVCADFNICSYDEEQLAWCISSSGLSGFLWAPFVLSHLQAHNQPKLHICVQPFTLAAKQTAGKVSWVLPTSNFSTRVQPDDDTPDSLEPRLLVRFGGLSGTSLISTHMISHLLVQLMERKNITWVCHLLLKVMRENRYLPVYN